LIKDEKRDLLVAVEANKPLFVFLKNTGPNDVVAYSLKWEFLNANGTVVTRSISFANPGAFSGAKPSAVDRTLMESVSLVRSNTSKFVSLDSSLGSLVHSVLNNGGQPGTDELYRALNAYLARSKESRDALLGTATAGSVSLDGAFFDDGTFVGPDTTNLFAKLQAEIAAQKDVAGVVNQGLKEEKSPQDISRQVEEIARDPRLRQFDDPALSNHYNHFAKLFARELLNIKEAKGNGNMLKHAKRILDTEYPVLRKKNEKR
jgi:hypothetical protein